MNRYPQKPAPVEALLEAFALDREYVSPGMCRISDYEELPLILQRIARQHCKAPFAWCAWADEGRTLFVTARRVSSRLPRREGPILRIGFYDEDGRLMSAAAWTQVYAGIWKLVAVGGIRSAGEARSHMQPSVKRVIGAMHSLQDENHNANYGS